MRTHCTSPAAKPQAASPAADPAPLSDLVTSVWVSKLTGINRQTLIAWSKVGLFPKPVLRVGSKFIRFSRSDVLAWLRERGLIEDAAQGKG
jgi:predicted DNA-binding transcriptional regulator AlpA